ncbi:hypothetical protein L1987_57761 [Smallanthus sonchifolius]|uniref:Uncharacterized protein n=1 Tax=Smallanthus sonchifolius TaxID=185202 RepID=A0ACB9DEE4_9ASTR|nr:hypothetical protein L1987_57761 [Smallanthus sonchifolius]
MINVLVICSNSYSNCGYSLVDQNVASTSCTTQDSDSEDDETMFQESSNDFQNIVDDSSTPAQSEGEIHSNLDVVIQTSDIPHIPVHKHHPTDNIIVDLNAGVQTRHRSLAENSCLYAQIGDTGIMETCLNACFISQTEQKNVAEALYEDCCIEAIVVVVRNKARLVVQGLNQQEGVDYTEVYAPVARIEMIQLFIAYASFKGFKAPRAWYETLSVHLLENGFERGRIDSTLFIKKVGGDILLVQVYMDDIIFGSTNMDMCKDFERVMKLKLDMSSMGELSFFLGLQVDQKEDGFYIHQMKYVSDILKKFEMSDTSTFSTPIPVNHKLDADSKGKEVDCRLYRGVIGSLMYLTASRRDIMFAIMEVVYIESGCMVVINSWETDSYPSNAKSKHRLQFQHVRPNTSQQPVVVPKSCGFSNI